MLFGNSRSISEKGGHNREGERAEGAEARMLGVVAGGKPAGEKWASLLLQLWSRVKGAS